MTDINKQLKIILTSPYISIDEQVGVILRFLKEAGYQTHEEAQGLVDTAMIMARKGYVKLAESKVIKQCTSKKPRCNARIKTKGKSLCCRYGWQSLKEKPASEVKG